MRSRIVLDTNFLSALPNRSDLHHSRAQGDYAAFTRSHEIFAPRSVQLELNIITSHRSVDYSLLIEHLAIKWIDIDEDFAKGHLDFMSTLGRTIKPMDSSILYCAYEIEAELLTYDKKLSKLAELSGVKLFDSN